MQATSQREKNSMLYECTKLAAKDAEVVNFGVFRDENASISYIETAVCACLLLGLGHGWMGELNMQDTLRRLFDGEFGCGYPPEEAERKRADTLRLKAINASVKRPLVEALPLLDRELVKKALLRVYDCIREHGRREVVELLEKYL